jgi:hypothetical protein
LGAVTTEISFLYIRIKHCLEAAAWPLKEFEDCEERHRRELQLT